MINKLIKEAYNNAVLHGWEDQDRSFGDMIALTHSELSEALEDYRENKEYNNIYYDNKKPCGIPIELADAVIRIFDICGKYEIDLEKAIKLKMEYNKDRPYKHNNKKI